MPVLIQCRMSMFGMSALAFGTALLSSTAASAQQDAGALHDPQMDVESRQLQDIIVTARKQPELLQNVPTAITVIDTNQLAANHSTRLDDLSSYVTSLNIVTRADNSPDVTIRGVGAFGVTPGVGFYVNDVQQFEGQSVRPVDIASVEVLKGPQGTLYGGTNIGGAIKYITKLPAKELEAEISGEIGSYRAREISAAVSGPLGGDFGARISGFASSDHGFVFDPTLNATLGGEAEQGGRLTLHYAGADTSATFYFSGDHLRSSNENLYYAPADDHSYALQVTANVRPFYHRGLYSPNLVLEHSLSDSVKLTSISSYFYANADSRTDGDHRAVPIFDVFQTLNTQVLSQELRLGSQELGAFKWVLGLYAQQVRQRFQQTNNFDFSVLTDDPADVGNDLTSTRHVQRQLSVFGNGIYTLNRFDLEAGARIEYFKNTLDDLIGNTHTQRDGTVVLPRGSVTFHASKDSILYGSVSVGIEPADSIAENAGTSTYNSEHTVNYEAGGKASLLGRRLRLSGDLFYITYRNRLFSTIDGATLVGITRNIGPSYNYGVEAEATFKLTRQLLVNAGGSYVKAKWKHALVFDPTVDATVDLNGRTAPFTPEYQINVGLTWQHPIGHDRFVDLHGRATFLGQQWWDVTDHYQQRPYALANFGAALEGKRWTLSADLKNAFDKRYNTIFAAAEEIGAPFNTASVGRPREVFLSLALKY